MNFRRSRSVATETPCSSPSVLSALRSPIRLPPNRYLVRPLPYRLKTETLRTRSRLGIFAVVSKGRGPRPSATTFRRHREGT